MGGADQGDLLGIGDQIATDEDSWVELTFIDGTIVRIEENVTLTIEDLKEALEGPAERQTIIRKVLELLRGSIKFTSGSEAKGYEIHAPTAAVGIRGTEFVLEATEDGTTTLIVLDGEVEFSNRAGSKGVVVHRHETSIVKPGGTPTTPKPAEPEILARWGESAEDTRPSRLSPWVWILMAFGAVLITALSIRKYRLSRRYQTVAKPELKQATAGGVKHLAYCSKCGAHLKPGADICHKCGASATRDTGSVAP